MKSIRIAAACLSLIASVTVVTAAAAQYNPVTYKHYYYDSSRNAWVGESWFYCDGSIQTFGMVTGEFTEEFIQSCP